jgi:membrane associated rhomboid family serine protease
MVRLALVIGATWLSFPASAARQTTLPGVLVGEFAVLCLIVAGANVRLRRQGGLPPIVLGPESISLPRNPLSARTTTINYEDVRSVSIVGRSVTSLLVIDTRRRIFRFPHAGFARPDALARLREGIKARILSMPGGQARWAAIDARQGLADRLAYVRPWGTWTVALLIMIVFGLQVLLQAPGNDMALLDQGANASLLVRDGEWFRLVTASLLHLNARHAVGNALFLVVIGGILEPLIGLRQFLLVLLATCLAAQALSAEVGLHSGSYVYSVGISGGLYGLIGALAALTLRFGAHLPGGFRLPLRAWAMIAISVLALPFFVLQVDHAAHIGGFASGLLLGLLLLRNRGAVLEASTSRAAPTLALGAVACVWGAGLVWAVAHEASTAARSADHYALAADMLAADHFAPMSRNFVAWAVAVDPAAPAEALENARQLARQGVMQERHVQRPNRFVTAAILDTEAVLSHRLGNDDEAIRLELPLIWTVPQTGSHLAAFVEKAWRRRGITMQGDAGPPPVMAIGHGVLLLTRDAQVKKQTDVLALLHRNNELAGILRFQLVPGFSGTQILPLPSNEGAPGLSPPPPIWTDGQSRIDIARMDADGCGCAWPTLVPGYFAYQPALSAIP